MKCEEISKELVAYLDRRANSAERRAVEEHLSACAACHARAEDFRKLWGVLDEMQVIEPSLGFDARVRARAEAELRSRWFGWVVPQPRLAFSMALLAALTVWMARLPAAPAPSITASQVELAEQEDFNAIKDLGVLENYDVLTKFDALSELPPLPARQRTQPRPSDAVTND